MKKGGLLSFLYWNPNLQEGSVTFNLNVVLQDSIQTGRSASWH